MASSVFSWTGSALAGVAETLGLLFLMLAGGDLLMQKVVSVMPTIRDKKSAIALWRDIQNGISSYLLSVTIINICFGLAVGGSLWGLGMPGAAMWGGVAAFLNFVPFFGPVVGMLAVGMAGILAFDTLGQGLLPMGAYLALHLLEANVVTPFAVGRRSTLNPVAMFVALILFGWLWGVVGGLLAIPLLVIAKATCDRIPLCKPWAEVLSR